LVRELEREALESSAAGRFEAVRAYGLVVRSGTEWQISQDAMTALFAPIDSSDRREALGRMAVHPHLFRELRKEYPHVLPSEETLRLSLIKRGFTAEAGEKAAKVFLASIRFAADGSEAPFHNNTVLR
jgi:hypothetical protein